MAQGSQNDGNVPDEVIIGLLAAVEHGADSVKHTAGYNEGQKLPAGIVDEHGQNENGQPAHGHVDGHGQGGMGFGRNAFEKHTADHHDPFHSQDKPAGPVVDQGQTDGGIGAGNGQQNGDVVQLAEHVFPGRVIGHDVIETAAAKHDNHADQINADAGGLQPAALQIGVDSQKRHGKQQQKHHDAVADGIADFFTKAQLFGVFHGGGGFHERVSFHRMSRLLKKE